MTTIIQKWDNKSTKLPANFLPYGNTAGKSNSIPMDFRNFFSKALNTVTGRSKKYNGFISTTDLPINNAWNETDFLTAAEISLYTNRAIDKRAEKVSEIQFKIQDSKGNEKEDPILQVLYKPNNFFTGRQFWKLYQKYYDLIGEAYIWIERASSGIGGTKQIKGLHLLIPTNITKKYGEDGAISAYEYKTGKSTNTYQPDEVIYIRNPDPKKPLDGQSLLKAGINAILTETQISTYHSRILKNGGRVEGIFKFKTEKLTEDQLKGMTDRYEKKYASAKKAGTPLFLGGDADYIKTGLSPDELGYLETKKATLQDICILTGVPISMLGSTSDVKFDNADADRTIFLGETIKPLLTTLTEALDVAFFPTSNLTLTYVDPTPENVDTKLKKIDNGIKNYYMTINEAREEMGLDPVSNGDSILVPFTLTDLGSEGYVEPADDTTGKRYKTTKNMENPLKDDAVRELYGKMQIKRLDAREKTFKKQLGTYLEDQKNRLVEKLQPNKARIFRRKGLLEDSLNITLEVGIGKDKLLPILTELLKQAGIDAVKLVGSDYDFQLRDNIVSWLEKRADVFLTSINETTFKALQTQFEESLAAGEGREDLIKRIEQTYGNIEKNRAGLIARTEVHNATQYGTVQGYKQAGLTTKIWVATLDANTRDSHAVLDGEERPIDTPFSNGLMFPGDPNGPADEVINCRCVI